jgi:branched-chain amino acid transport system substrate-binding protein
MKKLYKNLMLVMIPMLVLSVISLNVKVSAAPTIKIGILFPKYLTQGGGGFGGSGNGGMYDGAQMAAKEINDAGGINVGGTKENIVLDFQDEGALDPTLVPPNYNTAISQASMTAMLTGGDQFIVGGFRTESTTAALATLQSWNTGGNTPVPFWICGAATGSLVNINQTQNPGGQWVFRTTPVNDTQLFYTVANYIKQYLAPTLAAMYTNATYPPETPGQFRYALIAEQLSWTAQMSFLLTAPAGYGGLTPGYSYFLGPKVNTSGVQGGAASFPGENLVAATGYDFTSLVSTLKSQNVHLIIDIFTMPEVNNLITAIKAANMATMVVGIDVPGQQQSHWSDTSGDADGECLLCWSGTGTPIVPGVTDVFFKNFCSFSGGYWPMYTASGAYDSIYGIKDAIERAGSTDVNTLLPAIQGTLRVATTGEFKYASNDVFANSNGVNWTLYEDKPYGWARSEMVQWVKNTTVPSSPYPSVGAQMNAVDPIDQVYSRKTMIPPSMYSLAAWDINFDGKVSLADLVALAHAYGSKFGNVNWNISADLDINGAVSLSDLVALATHYGLSAPLWPLR